MVILFLTTAQYDNQVSMKKRICGIQQMGIGVPNVEVAWSWYRRNFGVDVRIFEEAAEAPLMIDYTGGKVHSRTATLALSMDGGGGFEIWQFTSRTTEKASFELQLGDYGMIACKIKSRDVNASYENMLKNGVASLSKVSKTPDNKDHFFVKGPNGNIFEVVESSDWFSHTKHPSHCGGVAGSIIGVSDIDESLKLYRDVLAYDEVVYDQTDSFEDLDFFPSGKGRFRRVLLKHSVKRTGPFAPLLGDSTIELVQSLERKDCKKIFENRFWGDWGFIHLCFDIQGMDALKAECEAKGFPFTVDSSDTFDMGEAGGRFSYVEDPDGTLIEFVETHKVPILKKIGWYIHLKNRKPGKSLPRIILKLMGLNRFKD